MLQLDFDSPRTKGAWCPKARGRDSKECCWESKTEVQPQVVQFLWSMEWLCSAGLSPTSRAALFEEERRAELERQKRPEDEVPWWQLMNQTPARKHFTLSECAWKVVGKLKKRNVESWDRCLLRPPKTECSLPNERPKDLWLWFRQNPLLKSISDSLWISWFTWISTEHSEAHGRISKCELILFWTFSVTNPSISVSVTKFSHFLRTFSKSTTFARINQPCCVRTVWRRWPLHAATHQPGMKSAQRDPHESMRCFWFVARARFCYDTLLKQKSNQWPIVLLLFFFFHSLYVTVAVKQTIEVGSTSNIFKGVMQYFLDFFQEK